MVHRLAQQVTFNNSPFVGSGMGAWPGYHHHGFSPMDMVAQPVYAQFAPPGPPSPPQQPQPQQHQQQQPQPPQQQRSATAPQQPQQPPPPQHIVISEQVPATGAQPSQPNTMITITTESASGQGPIFMRATGPAGHAPAGVLPGNVYAPPGTPGHGMPRGMTVMTGRGVRGPPQPGQPQDSADAQVCLRSPGRGAATVEGGVEMAGRGCAGVGRDPGLREEVWQVVEGGGWWMVVKGFGGLLGEGGMEGCGGLWRVVGCVWRGVGGGGMEGCGGVRGGCGGVWGVVEGSVRSVGYMISLHGGWQASSTQATDGTPHNPPIYTTLYNLRQPSPSTALQHRRALNHQERPCRWISPCWTRA